MLNSLNQEESSKWQTWKRVRKQKKNIRSCPRFTDPQGSASTQKSCILIQRAGVNLPPKVKLPVWDQPSQSTDSSSSSSQAFGVAELLQIPPVPLRPAFPRLPNSRVRLQGVGNREPPVWTGSTRAWYFFIPGEPSTQKSMARSTPQFLPSGLCGRQLSL